MSTIKLTFLQLDILQAAEKNPVIYVHPRSAAGRSLVNLSLIESDRVENWYHITPAGRDHLASLNTKKP